VAAAFGARALACRLGGRESPEGKGRTLPRSPSRSSRRNDPRGESYRSRREAEAADPPDHCTRPAHLQACLTRAQEQVFGQRLLKEPGLLLPGADDLIGEREVSSGSVRRQLTVIEFDRSDVEHAPSRAPRTGILELVTEEAARFRGYGRPAPVV
jgi:hypothetical protein